MRLELIGVESLPEIRPGDDLAALTLAALARMGLRLRPGDVLVVAQKVVSKAEGRLRDLSTVVAGEEAGRLAARLEHEPTFVQVVLDESVRLVRQERVLITETRHGYVCANAGVDRSNVPGETVVALLPVDCDASAARLRARILELEGVEVGVVVADSFGRAWRLGLVNVALGAAGVPALVDYRGQLDDVGKELHVTVIAAADELAGAAELVMGKTGRTPVALVRGYQADTPAGTGRDLVRPAELDLFR